jgi:heme o synthase
MRTAAATGQVRTAPSLAVVRDVSLLGKPRLSGLVVCTAAAGMWLAPGRLDGVRAVIVLSATTLVVGAANALNNYLEREVDARMRRTRDRPLPSGRLGAWVALAVGLGLQAVAVPALAWYANTLTAALAAIALVTYVCVYTPMKQRSTSALFLGAVPGAIPPLMGWAAVTGRLDAGGLALFGILFLWQLPHFLAISIYLKDDYARGGLKVFALVHGERATKICAALASLALLPMTLVPLPLELAGPAYGVTAVVLGAGLFGYALSGLWRPEGSARWARNLFLLTLVHLTLLFAALLAWGTR